MTNELSVIHVGCKVRSKTFGDGEIVDVDPRSTRPVVVRFDGYAGMHSFSSAGLYSPHLSDSEFDGRNIHLINFPVVRVGYKLFTQRKDGSLGPLFINRGYHVDLDVWHVAEEIPTRGYAFRPGWHICSEQSAPHLKEREGRVWAKVEFANFKEMQRPKAQGGLWYIATHMKVLQILPTTN